MQPPNIPVLEHSLAPAVDAVQDAIAEAKSVRLRPDPAVRVERDVYVYRSLIGLRNFK